MTSATTTRPAARQAALRGDRVALAAICAGFFLNQLDATIVNVALPAVGRDLGGSLGGLQWVIDSYTLPLAALMLPAGAIADRLGARRVFLAGLVVFAAGSAACATAPSLTWLIVARSGQGLGAAALLPCSLALIVHQFPEPQRRARALGVWGGIAGLGMAAGPALGGIIIAALGWRVVFLVNVLVGIVALAAARWAVSESPRQPSRRVDVPGVIIGIAGLGFLITGFIEAGQHGWTQPLCLLAAGVVAAPAFALAERRSSSPMTPGWLVRSRPLTAAIGVGFLFKAGGRPPGGGHDGRCWPAFR